MAEKKFAGVSGAVTVEVDRVGEDTTLSQIVRLVEEAQGKNLRFDVRIEPDIVIQINEDSFRRMLTILLDNALKYTPDGGRIVVELSAHKKMAVLSIENTTAELISKDDLHHIFDRFYRTDRSRNSETGGHGIGLSIAKAITEAHGGSISAATKTGYDFRVTVTLPM